MALLLVLLTAILAFSLASTDQCVSSPGSSIDLFLRSHKNASGDWIITIETQRLTIEEDPREIVVKVQQETKVCGKKQIQQLVAVAVYPSLQDTLMPGAIESSTTRPTTMTTTSTTTKPPTATTSTSTTTPKSCPRPGYQLYPGYNCYKAFPSEGEWKSWCEARGQCKRDGGDLMVMDNEREREDVFIPLLKSVSWTAFPWVGVYIPQAGNDWTTVKGGPALSTWWDAGYPLKNASAKCAFARSTGLLWNTNCGYISTFICEISP